MTDDELTTFATVGYVTVRDAVPDDAVAVMRTQTWEALGAHGIVEHDRSTWTLPDGRAWLAVSPASTGDASIGPEDSPRLCAVLDRVLGRQRSIPHDWGRAAVGLPEPGVEWDVPGTAWHFDHPYPAPGVVTAVNVFLLIDDVEPRGGGTAVVRNSPQLLDRLLERGAQYSTVGEQNRCFLDADEWTRGLAAPPTERTAERTARYLGDSEVDGITLRVDELCGRAGDVVVCHPALLHTISTNAAERARLMRVQRIRTLASNRS